MLFEMKMSKRWDLGETLGWGLSWVKLCSCPPGGANFPLMSRWTSNEPFTLWLCAQPGSPKQTEFPRCPVGDVPSFGPLSVSFGMWALCKEGKEKQRTVSYSYNCARAQRKKSTRALWLYSARVAQKIYLHFSSTRARNETALCRLSAGILHTQ